MSNLTSSFVGGDAEVGFLDDVVDGGDAKATEAGAEPAHMIAIETVKSLPFAALKLLKPSRQARLLGHLSRAIGSVRTITVSTIGYYSDWLMLALFRAMGTWNCGSHSGEMSAECGRPNGSRLRRSLMKHASRTATSESWNAAAEILL